MRMRALLVLLTLAGCGSDGKKFVPPPPAETGSLIVRWTIEDVDGEPLDCADLDVIKATVAIGSEPQTIACGDTPSASFEGILPGRLPVVIRLLNSVDIELASQTDNVDIVGGMQTEYDHTFVINQDVFDTGRIEAQWRVDFRPAAQACSTVGAQTVRLNTDAGSIADIDMMIPCEDGRVAIENARTGGYTFFFRLLDADGDQIALEPVSSVAVRANDTAQISISFDTEVIPPGMLNVEWTLTGSVATADNCLDAGAQDVTVSLFVEDPLNKGEYLLDQQETTPCSDQSLMLQAERENGYRVTSRLVDSFNIPVSTDTQDDIDLRTGSATVSVDFEF